MFKVGDRVKVTDDVLTSILKPDIINLKNRFGKIRVIRSDIQHGIGVVFDEYVGGHDLLFDDEFSCEDGYGWYLSSKELILVSRKKQQLELFDV